MSQRLDGIEPRCLDGGEHPEDHADRGAETEAHDDRPQGNVRLLETGAELWAKQENLTGCDRGVGWMGFSGWRLAVLDR